MALVDLLRSFGVQPTAVIGHSSGEIAAAYCAGTISRTSGWKIAYYRGLISTALAKFGRSRGAMMAVGLSEAAVQKYLDKADEHTKGAVVGCVNSPKNVTLTGTVESLTALRSSFAKDNVFYQMLKVENAYHSKSMEEVALEYWKLLGTIEAGAVPLNEVEVPVMFSSVTGQRITASQVCDAEYWVQNLVSPVRFSDALSQMLSQHSARQIKKFGMPNKAQGLDINYLLEVGPHGALRRAIKEILESIPNGSSISYDSLLTRNVSSLDTLLGAMSRLICLGLPFNLMALNNPDGRNLQLLIDLPEYPFNHAQRYWSESRLSKNVRFRKHARNELLGSQVPDWNSTEARWRMYIRLSENEWIKDHRVSPRYNTARAMLKC
jgi:acyl transferase domain-containing protein